MTTLQIWECILYLKIINNVILIDNTNFWLSTKLFVTSDVFGVPYKCLDNILFQLSMTDFHKLFMDKINKMIKKKPGILLGSSYDLW